jgi:hypothetical protein
MVGNPGFYFFLWQPGNFRPILIWLGVNRRGSVTGLPDLKDVLINCLSDLSELL